MERSLPRPGLARQAVALWRGPLARQVLWLTAPFALQQVIRLATNVVLTRLLAPEMFGVMLLVNTLRTGTELLSDIGVGQSVVRSPHAHDRVFLDTAWTVQLLRGAGLMLIALLAAEPLARAYGNPDLAGIVALVSLTFLLVGLQSPEIFLMQRDMRLVQRGAYDLACAVAQSVITVALAWVWGNLWALVWGLVLGQLFATAMTYAFGPLRVPRLVWRREFAGEIFHFGKWVFLSTAVYFAAMSADRIYFSAVLPLALVGIYGVARTFADLLMALAQRLGAFLVFPKVVELRQRSADVASRFTHNRRLALGAIAVAMAGMLAGSDRLILILYDQRYHAAAFMLPVLMASIWFAVLAAFGESTLFGLDRPRAAALGNAAKFAVLMVGLPLAVPHGGVFAGLLVLLAAEFARWLALSVALSREGLAALGDDAAMTVAIAVAAVGLKLVGSRLGLVPSIDQWWTLGALVHG